MSLITCNECGTKVSNRATACPKCGSPIKNQSRWGCLIGIGASIAVIIAILSTCDSGKPQKTMSVEVGRGREVLEIKNIGTPDIEGKIMVVYINGSPPFAYMTACDAPAIGDTVRIPLSSFAKKDGQRFNPVAYAVREIWVGGAGYDYLSFE